MHEKMDLAKSTGKPLGHQNLTFYKRDMNQLKLRNDSLMSLVMVELQRKWKEVGFISGWSKHLRIAVEEERT